MNIYDIATTLGILAGGGSVLTTPVAQQILPNIKTINMVSYAQNIQQQLAAGDKEQLMTFLSNNPNPWRRDAQHYAPGIVFHGDNVIINCTSDYAVLSYQVSAGIWKQISTPLDYPFCGLQYNPFK